MESKNNWKGKCIRLLFPLIHFMLSFLYDKSVFVFESEINIAPIAMNQIVSDKAERIFAYIMTKVVGAVFIFLVWHIIWYVKDNYKNRAIQFFTVLSILMSALMVLIYPHFIDSVIDTFMTYAYAIRFSPDYWHSAYSSLIYGGMLTVIPSPKALAPLQTVLLIATIGYLHIRICGSPVLQGRGKWLPFCVLLITESIFLFGSLYRTTQYSILAIYVFSVVIMDMIDHKKRPTVEEMFIAFLIAFASIWRTEGIIIGLGTMITLIMFAEKSTKKKILTFITYIVAIVLLLIPQKLGDAKYYGKDYKFINSFAVLQNILNDETHNLSYAGVDKDMEAIEAIVPIQLLQEYGLDGYRRYNYANGHSDINQSLATKDAGKAFEKAYTRLIAHNLRIYIKTQGYSLLAALGLKDSDYRAPYRGAHYECPNWELKIWDIGRADVHNRPDTKAVMDGKLRVCALQAFSLVRNNIIRFQVKTKYRALSSIAIILALLGIVVSQAIAFFQKKKENIYFLLLSSILICQFAAIVLVMPEGNYWYFHPTIYMGGVTFLLFILKMISDRSTNKRKR